MTEAAVELPRYDRTARRAHQWTMIVLVGAGLILQGVPGRLPIAIAGAIMLVGRFWWPADVVRQFVGGRGVAWIVWRLTVRRDCGRRSASRRTDGRPWSCSPRPAARPAAPRSIQRSRRLPSGSVRRCAS